MAAKKKTALAGLNMALLASIVLAGDDGMLVSSADAAPFVANQPPLVEINPTIDPVTSNFWTRATKAGKTLSATQAQTGFAGGAVATNADKPKFVIAKIAAASLPVSKRAPGEKRESIYPFDQLEAPNGDQLHSFFIPATAEVDKPWKKYSSIVSSNTRKYAVADATNPMKTVTRKGVAKQIANYIPVRQFQIKGPVDGAAFGQPGVMGAVVSRTK